MWERFRRKAFQSTPLEEMVAKATQQTKLKRVLRVWDLLLMGLGCLIGSGIFVLTGEIAKTTTGPSVILSYGVAGLAALFAALCYAEFASDVPISGSAYNYVELVFGEFMGWIAASSMVAELVLGTCMVAKGLSGYVATLIGLESDALLIKTDHGMEIDILGAAVVAFLTALLTYGVRESFTFNGVTTAISVAVIAFTVIASTSIIDTDNYTPFFPKEFGISGAFRGASIAFLSYTGFESITSVAEESSNPCRDIPLSVVSSTIVCTVLYMLMCGALVGMVPYQEIDVMSAFSTAFDDRGWNWASRIVSVGALCGITTSLFGNAYAQSRMVMVVSREGFIPKILGSVNERTGTPMIATVLTGIIATVLTLLLDISTLSSMVSMGTLTVYIFVCAACIWRRYCKTKGLNDVDANAPSANPRWITMRLALLIIIGVVEGLAVEHEWPLWLWLCSIGCLIAVLFSFCGLPVIYRSSKLQFSFQPVVASLGMVSCVHLIVSLGTNAYYRFVVWAVLSIAVYLFYGMYHTKEAVFHDVSPLL